ncbi:MAG: type IV pilus modification protein PilV [Pseudomonadota bacterium]
MTHRSNIASNHRQRGVGLIEVLIAVLVMSVGLLGIASLQARTIKNNESSLQRTQAVMLSYFIIDAMRVNRAEALVGAYNIGKTCITPAAGSSLASRDINAWFVALKANLGESGATSSEFKTCGQINCATDGTGRCNITVFWDESRAETGSTTQSIETRTRL